jgi:VWFA-related protein
VPGDPDVTHQTPGLMATEVTARDLFQVNTVVTMDHSGSMREEIETAKAAARLYIENMRNGDQAAVIKFASDVRVVQSFTRDRRALIQAVNRQPAGGKTLLYDALIASIGLIKQENGRRAVIAYTDGFDNRSMSSKNAVIDSAITYGIPIFTIGLGDSVSQSVLQEISLATGGIYLHAPTADDLKDIFLQLSTVINNYYVMAHSSTDPERNNTWRIVDVTLNHQRWQQRAVGRYFVPAKSLKYDVAISQASRTDSVGQINGVSRNIARTGEVYSYEISLTNIGRETVRDIYLTDVFPDSVRVGGFSIEPLSANADSAVWRFPALDGGSSLNISFNATVPAAMPAGITPLENVARFVAERDTVTANNFSADTVYAVGAISPPPQINIDVAISQVSATDSFSVVAGDTLKLVTPGETISYRLRIANLGDSTAKNIRLTNVFADSVAASDFSVLPASANDDSATWQFAELELDSSIVINFIATVRPVMPKQRVALINIARVLADGDTLLINNFSADTVFTAGAAPPPPERIDAAISLTAITDSIRIINGDILKYVKSGETYTYRIHLDNLGTVTARNIRVTNVFPDSISAHGFSVTPAALFADSATWQFAELSAGGTIEIDFLATVRPVMPLGETRLVNIARVEADQDTLLSNNFSVENTVIAIQAESPPRRFVDVSIAQFSITDSVSVVADDTTKFVRTGETFAYRLWVRNLGDTTASQILVTDIFPDSILAGGFSVTPLNANADSAQWQFNELGAGDTLRITFQAVVKPNLPATLMALVNLARVTVDGDVDLSNNLTSDTVYGVAKAAGAPKLPEIIVFPTVVQVGDSIEVAVRTYAPLAEWDVLVYFADGTVHESYADDFIRESSLQPQVWYRMNPVFKETSLRTAAYSENVIFELRTHDVFGNRAAVRATAVLQSANDLVLDRNVFEPANGEPLGINFRLSSNRVASLELRDIAGRRVARLAERAFDAGWNLLNWDGRSENGDLVGSGVYLVTIKSQEFKSWRKVVVVR